MSIRHSLLSSLVLSLGFATAHAADTYAIDPVHTAAIFKVKHLGVSYTYGHFNDVAGTITIDAANPSASKVEVLIQTGSVDTHNEKRDGHLASPDFFDAKQFPVMSFTSTAFKKIDDSTYEVTGGFTLRGVSKPLTVKVVKVGEGKDPWGGFRSGYECTFTIKRSDFAMTKMLDAVGDEVAVTFSTEGVKK